MDRQRELIEAARATARALGTEKLRIRDFTDRTGIVPATIYRHFDSWADMCREAGIAPAHDSRRRSDDEVFSAMRDAFLACGGIGTLARFLRHFRYSEGVFGARRWTWRKALHAFREWAEQEAPDFPYMDQLPVTPERPSPAYPAPWRPAAGRRIGPAINYRALQHAPVNEMGVVVLFSMAAEDLGFMLETVETGFPDCEGKRLAADGSLRRVRIEFEYRSRAFREHRHDPAGCDLIVCWIHDWPDCPLEVLELRSALAASMGAGGTDSTVGAGETARPIDRSLDTRREHPASLG